MAGDARTRPLLERDVAADPLAQFRAWFGDARASGVPVPETVALATATAAGRPSVRMLLLKEADERGLVVCTGLDSRKGRDLAENPRGALLFHWQPVGRQLRVEGVVEAVAEAESDAVFAARPRGSRLAAWASRQSEPVASREALEAAARDAAARFEGGDVPRPPRWGCVRLVPELWEFWQHRENRLHDRLRYVRSGDGWLLERLAP